MRKIVFLLYFFSIALATAQAQESTADSLIASLLARNSKLNPSDLLFVHTDKTLYTNNETIWFSGYLTRATYPQDHTILSVAVANAENREVVLRSRYLMEDGLSFGSLQLPDTIPPGNYFFMAFSNVMRGDGKPLAIFTQPITIKSIRQQDFKVSAFLLDTALRDGVARVQVNLSVDDTKTKEKPLLKYSINDDPARIELLKERSFIIHIPAAQLNRAQPTLLASVRFKNQTQHLTLKLPEAKHKAIEVHFFPEGGSLVTGMPSLVGWEARTIYGLPVALTGILLENGHPIDTLDTNVYGIGKFRLTPKEGAAYWLKVNSNDYLSRDTIYTLPLPTKQGIVIHIPRAIVDDSVQLFLYSAHPRTVQVLVHNYREAFATFRTALKPSGTKLKIALPGLPKGIATITILNESGQPLAERLFFAHYDHKVQADIHSDKLVYKKRDTVSVRIKLKDRLGRPVQGIVSAAAVQYNRLEGSKKQDIESYTYLSQEIGNLPQSAGQSGISDQAYLEDIFLVKGWRRFTWQDMVDHTAKDTIGLDIPKIIGKVTFNGKPLRKAVALSVIRDSTIRLITTENDGSFPIDQNEFLIREGRKAMVVVSEKNRVPYGINVSDPFLKIAEQLGKEAKQAITGPGKSIGVGNLQLSGFDQAISLSEVVIKGDNSSSLYGSKGASGSNACGDYVDEWGYINYAYSAGRGNNTQPIKGKAYMIRTDITGYGPGTHNVFSVRQIIYSGCMVEDTKSVFEIEGVYLAREFYPISPNDILLSEPLFQSTLFWKPGITTDAGGEFHFSFRTGDVTGPFSIILQGIAYDDTIFGVHNFTVR